MDRLMELKELVNKEIGSVIDQGCVKPDQWGNLGEAVDILKDIATTESMTSWEPERSYGVDNWEAQYQPVTTRSYTRPMPMPKYPNSYDNMPVRNNNSYGDDMMYAIRVLEMELDQTQDPEKRNHLVKTLEMLRKQR